MISAQKMPCRLTFDFPYKGIYSVLFTSFNSAPFKLLQSFIVASVECLSSSGSVIVVSGLSCRSYQRREHLSCFPSYQRDFVSPLPTRALLHICSCSCHKCSSNMRHTIRVRRQKNPTSQSSIHICQAHLYRLGTEPRSLF